MSTMFFSICGDQTLSSPLTFFSCIFMLFFLCGNLCSHGVGFVIVCGLGPHVIITAEPLVLCVMAFFALFLKLCLACVNSYSIIHAHVVAVLISGVEPGSNFSMGHLWRHETNINAGGEAGKEILYVLICDSQ